MNIQQCGIVMFCLYICLSVLQFECNYGKSIHLVKGIEARYKETSP